MALLSCQFRLKTLQVDSWKGAKQKRLKNEKEGLEKTSPFLMCSTFLASVPAFQGYSCGFTVFLSNDLNSVRLSFLASFLPITTKGLIYGIKGAIMAGINIVIICNISYPSFGASIDHVLSILHRFICSVFAVFPCYSHFLHLPFCFQKLYNTVKLLNEVNIYHGGDLNETHQSCISTAKGKPVIVCGDFNVAANPIDIKNPKANEKNAGYTIQEREAFQRLLGAGFTDTYRYLHPDKVEYSWWSYRFKARERNAGWRLDYFLTSEFAKDKILDAKIHTEVLGSDHCPVSLDINI